MSYSKTDEIIANELTGVILRKLWEIHGTEPTPGARGWLQEKYGVSEEVRVQRIYRAVVKKIMARERARR